MSQHSVILIVDIISTSPVHIHIDSEITTIQWQNFTCVNEKVDLKSKVKVKPVLLSETLPLFQGNGDEPHWSSHHSTGGL